jgi:hypothetical protein
VAAVNAGPNLTTSRITPWCDDSDDPERLDVINGLAACTTHDVAFGTTRVLDALRLVVVVSVSGACLRKLGSDAV